MRGAFKFVLDTNNILYIGFSSGDYHQDICGNLSYDRVEAAGWLAYDSSEQHWCVNGKSIGYGVSFTPEQAHKIESFLKDHTPLSVGDLMNDNGRVQFSIN